MFRALDLTPDLLAAQGRALRALARSLIGENDADDVVQETWLACLRHPQAVPERVSAWLGTVTKRLALRRRRGEGRRRARERHAAAPERIEALELRTLEREEALRVVTQALLGLDEPFKTALLLRYYEDRSPADIAAALGLPLATVKSRLVRGLERLRAKLGTEFAGDHERADRALLALAALPGPGLALGGGAVAGAAAGGALALGAKLAAVAAAVVLASASLAWWKLGGGQEPAELARASAPALVTIPQASGADDPSGTIASLAGGATSDDGGARRESVAPAAPAPESAEPFPGEASFPYTIRGQVRDERDLPLAGARVFLGPHRFPLNRIAVTDEEGRFAFAFAGRRATMACAFTVDDGSGRALGLRELALVSGRELVVDVGLGAGASRHTASLRIPERAAAEKQAVELALSEEHSADTLVLSIGSELALRGDGPLERAPESVQRSDGRGIFVDSPPKVACERPARPAFVTLMDRLRIEEVDRATVELKLGHYFPAVAGLEAGAEPLPPATVRGVVRDALGRPVAGAEVGWGPAGRTLTASVHSDADGAFVLADVPAGDCVLRAGGGDHGIACENVTLASGQERAWSPVLERGAEVVGRVVLGRDARAGMRIELWSAGSDALWCDSTLTGDDGRFAFPNVPAGAFELHVYAPVSTSSSSAFPVRVVRSVFAGADVGELALGAEEHRTSAVALAVLAPDGQPLPGAEVRLWQVSSGRGSFAGEPDEDGRLALAGLPHGEYRVDVGGPYGWRDLGSVWIDEDVELAPERFARTGHVQLHASSSDPAQPAPTLPTSLWSTHPDVFGLVDERKLERALLALPGGRYVLCSGAEHGARVETALEVRAGETTGLTLDVAPSRAVTVRPGAVDLAPASETSCRSCHAGPSGG